MEVKAKLLRLVQEPVQTLGEMLVYKGLDKIFDCKILELPDRGNKNRISRINDGTYRVVKRHSAKYGNHYHILDVEGRTLILIHFGNYYTDTLGCILAGKSFSDINKDGYRDVVSSKETMKKMLEVVPEEFQLTVINE
ncbi:hypothetical protein HCG49_17070 [Arenibacter sp. 6A1]|uniref:DUF5675 family protein n=1 Tax=Arenibacter sp. 6A1 TaxID=2720391 RepID=UPI001448698C|nr:DUF5675 family protein [Arenibacter sp. 6A1]NKI28268.1 hypothetical protein [Arenibacter sp. 6A1]